MDLTNNEVLNIKNPSRDLKKKIFCVESEEAGVELSTKAKNHLINFPFATVREMVEKMVLYTSLPSEQATEELFEDIFNPQRCNVIMPRFSHKVSCGFASPADDYKEGYLSLNEKFVKNPTSTFPVQAEGDCMRETIFSGDILLVDNSLEARHGDIILAVVNGEFTMKRLIVSGKNIYLRPDNPVYHDIIIEDPNNFEIRGVVTSIHRHLR